MAKRGQNEGSIRKRIDGTWEARVTIGQNQKTGKPKRLSRYFKTRKEAQDWISKTSHEKQTGAYIEPHTVTVGEWLDRWLMDYMKPHLKPTTWTGYETLIRRHLKPTIGDILLRELQAIELQRLYRAKLEKGRTDGKGGLSSHYVHYIHAVIHEALKQAVKEQLIYRNVAEAVKLPGKVDREIRPLSVDEIARFLEAAQDHRLGAAFLLELGTGLRRGELLALHWKEVDFKKGLLSVKFSLARAYVDRKKTKTALVFLEPKTKSSKRLIPIPEEIILELKALKARQNEERLFFGEAYEKNDLVFCSEDGRPLDPRNFSRRFENILKKARLPRIRFHDLRHTFATRLLELNEHPKIVQELLGHSRITTTLDIYSHVDPELKVKAAGRLNEMLFSHKGEPRLRPL
ncbi:MAG: site-specific integrase [bacterium]